MLQGTKITGPATGAGRQTVNIVLAA